MRTPKYTDSARYRTPYKRSEATDVRATIRRAQRELAEKPRATVQPLRKAAK